MEKQSNGSTCFVRVLCDPGYGDATNFRVTEAQQEGSVGFGHQHVLSLLFIHKAKNRPETYKHTNIKHKHEFIKGRLRPQKQRGCYLVCTVQLHYDLYTKDYKGG